MFAQLMTVENGMALKKIVPAQKQARISVHISVDIQERILALSAAALADGYKLDMSDEFTAAIERVVASNEKALQSLRKGVK